MTLTLAGLNALPRSEAAERFRACCGSSRWVETMIARRPYESVAALLAAAEESWRTAATADWEEAFAHHPRIGERVAPATVSAVAQAWSADEQGRAVGADPSTRAALIRATAEYERRFGRTYLVSAAGRTAEELSADLEARLRNNPEREFQVAVAELRKIARLRLTKLIGAGAGAETP